MIRKAYKMASNALGSNLLPYLFIRVANSDLVIDGKIVKEQISG